MKHYTDIIPLDLAEKLKEKGMPYIEIDCETYDSGTEYQRDEVWCNNTYAEVFDWLLEKGVVITIRADYYLNGEIAGWIPHYNHWGMKRCNAWHGAAEAAIEKALTLI